MNKIKNFKAKVENVIKKNSHIGIKMYLFYISHVFRPRRFQSRIFPEYPEFFL